MRRLKAALRDVLHSTRCRYSQIAKTGRSEFVA
jgi:hypothetical protein